MTAKKEVMRLSETAVVMSAVYGDEALVNLIELAKLIGLAKEQGAAEEREACEKLCEDIAYDFRCLYKGWKPYTGDEDGRADVYVDGKSDGAYECSEVIRKRAKPNQTGE